MNMKLLRVVVLGLGSFLISVSCASKPDTPPIQTLSAPGGTHPEAFSFLNRGNERFAEGRWGAAKVQFEEAVNVQPDLAEAHYNLALALERLGDAAQAKDHYIKAANLAPGHKVIWNSPPLRRYGNVPDKPRENTSAPVLPGIGGGGGLGGGLGGAGS
ncbi:MAG: tetratricopeptide repeat protein [Nitrospirales bacterium]